MKHYPHAEPRCGMCGSTNPIDYGLMCASCRAEDREIDAAMRKAFDMSLEHKYFLGEME